MNRIEYEERMKDERYQNLKVTKAADEKPYVFVSYRGNSWRKVLTEIVYKLQHTYGLHIYFDKDFSSDTNVWLEQFQKNMGSKYCKAVLCFIDEGYVTSYATLTELMHATNQKGDKIVPCNFTFDWKKATISMDEDTGLGVKTGDNPSYEKEKVFFCHEFNILKKKEDYESIENFYYDGKSQLLQSDCAKIMEVIQPKNQNQYAENDNFYRLYLLRQLLSKDDKDREYIDGSIFDDPERVRKFVKTGEWDSDSDPDPVPDPGSDTDTDTDPDSIRICDAYYHYTPKDADAVVGEIDGQYIILERSRQASSASYDRADKERSRLSDEGIVVDNIFKEDYIANSPSEAACIIAGGSVNGKAVFVDKAKINREQAEEILNRNISNGGGKGTGEPPEPPVPPEPTLPYYHYTSNGANAVVRKIDEKNFVILKGSRWAAEAKYGISISNRQRLEQEGVVENGVFVRDSEPFAGSAAAGIINGGSVSVNAAFTDKNKITEERANEILSNPNAAYGEASKRKGLF